MTPRRVAALLIAAVLLSVCPLFAQEAPLLVVALKGPTGIGMATLFRDQPALAGRSAEYQALAAPDQASARVLSGQADVAALPANLGLMLAAKTGAYKVAAVIAYGSLYVVGTAPGGQGLASLSGQSVQNIAKGSTPDHLLAFLLKAAGLSDKVTVTFKYGHPDLAQAIIAGRENLGVLPEPFVTRVLAQRPDARIVADLQAEYAAATGAPAGSSYPISVLLVKADTAQRSPAAVRELLQKARASQQWVLAQPALAGQAIEALGFGLTAAEASAAIPRLNLVWLDGQGMRTALNAFAKVLFEALPASVGGKLPGPETYLDF